MVSRGGGNELGECFLWGGVVEGGAGAVVEFVGDGARVGVGGWWWGCLWAGSGPRWRLVFSFVSLSQGLWGWAKNTPGSRWRRPWRWWRAVSLPWSRVRVLIAPSGSARMRRVRAPAPGRALPAPGEGPPGRGSRWRARPGSPIALAPLLADDQAAPSQFPGTTRPSIVRAPARSTACPRPGGSQPGGRVSTSARPAAGGSTIPCSYEASPPRWRVDPRAKSPRG